MFSFNIICDESAYVQMKSIFSKVYNIFLKSFYKHKTMYIKNLL